MTNMVNMRTTPTPRTINFSPSARTGRRKPPQMLTPAQDKRTTLEHLHKTNMPLEHMHKTHIQRRNTCTTQKYNVGTPPQDKPTTLEHLHKTNVQRYNLNTIKSVVRWRVDDYTCETMNGGQRHERRKILQLRRKRLQAVVYTYAVAVGSAAVP